MYKSVPWLCLLVPTGPAWARPAQRYLQETGDEWVKTGNLCASGHSLLNETPSLKLCNCGGQFDCQGTSKFQLLELHVGELNDIDSLQMAVGDDLWPSRRFYMNQDVLELDPEDPTAQPYVYTLISNGIGVGRRFSGAYAGLTSYLGESGTASLQFQDFISSSPQTAFQTTEVSRLDTCEMVEVAGDVRRLQGDGDGDDGDSEAGNVTTVAPDVALPSKIFCGDNTQISPGKIKMSLYGYTWGKNWESDVAGHDLVFFRWRLCFDSRSWYINQVLNGEGILGTGERVHVVDVQQEDGQPLVYWFPTFYMSGDHLDCTFAQDLLYNFPKWECPNTQTIGAVHVTASPAGAACAQDGLIVNIGFPLDRLQKDRWFLYTMEVNTSSTVTFSAISSAPPRASGTVALVPFFLWIHSSLC